MKKVILYLEDDPNDVELLRLALDRDRIEAEVHAVTSRAQYVEALRARRFDLILCDNAGAGFDGVSALEAARELCPAVPFILLSGARPEERAVEKLKQAGAAEYVTKSQLWRLGPLIQRSLPGTGAVPQEPLHRLVAAVQELSLARDLQTIMNIVRRTARALTGADGATFVLREGDLCFYAEEDAIAPLWKGRRFPMSACISGWAMLNRQPAVIPDIYQDPRIPAEAYRPTFVKSLAMVPIRTLAPIGAIGNYWATQHRASPEEVRLLQALADSTSVAMENVQLYEELEQRVRERTAELHFANEELEAFSYSVSHDLRAPLRGIEGFSQALREECAGALSGKGRDYIQRICDSTRRMARLIDDLLQLSRVSRAPLRKERVDLSRLAREIVATLQEASPRRRVEIIIPEGLSAEGDRGLLRILLENLLSNAWKYTSKREHARIELGRTPEGAYFVRDNGAGFDMAYAGKLFAPFQRMHSEAEFPGTGIGLATAQRIVHRHGGRIRAEAAMDRGATFLFTLS